MKFASLSFATVLIPAGAAWSEDHLAHERGARIVEQWCRLCHVRAADKPDPDMAPAFEKLVRRPGRDREFYARFMAEDHFPMTTFRLFEDEKQSVIAYLLSLQQR